TRLAARYRPDTPPAPDAVLDLIATLAPRLRDAEEPVEFGAVIDAAVLGRCLAEGVPVRIPARPQLGHWRDGRRVDHAALAADPRFIEALWDVMLDELDNPREFDALWREGRLQPVMRKLFARLLFYCIDGGLYIAVDAMDKLHRSVGITILEDIDGLRDELAALDLAHPLARTLRSGILDELGWDAFDDAEADIDRSYATRTRASWPVLVVNDDRKAIAVDPAGRVAEHRGDVPPNPDKCMVEMQAYYSAGEFLIGYHANQDIPLYWTSLPGEKTQVSWDMWWSPNHDHHETGYTFLTSHGDRITKHRRLRKGEIRFGPDQHTFYDGRTFWQQEPTGPDRRLKALDPETGELRDADPPAFLDPSLFGPGEEWVTHRCSLAPLPDGVIDSPLGCADGLLGFRVSRNASGGYRYARIDGVGGESAANIEPWGLLDLPGGGRVLLLASGDLIIAVDPDDGAWLWRVFRLENSWRPREDNDMARGTGCIPPPAFWHFLRPRDPEGSAALRETTVDTARKLLESGNPERVLPQVGHPRLLRGIGGLVEVAHRNLEQRDKILARVSRRQPLRLGVSSAQLGDAIDGLTTAEATSAAEETDQLELAVDFFTGRVDAVVATDGFEQLDSSCEWPQLLGRVGGLGWRAVTAVTTAEVRETLRRLLAFWAKSP
ncbi:MAG: hypothetical protein ACRD0P_20430, partial [Stackebrandtia sp.]